MKTAEKAKQKILSAGLAVYNPFTPIWFDRTMFDYIPAEGRVLNIGSGSTKLRAGVTNLDIKPFPNVDIVADAHALPFENEYFEGVLLNAVLEHTAKPWVVASEAQRVLRHDGIACVQSPFLEGVHDESDYFRFTLKGLISLFPDLEVVKSGVSGSINQILADLIRVHPVLTFERTWLQLPVKFIMSWLAAPVQHLDFMVRESPSMPRYARACYFVGRKR